MTFRQFLKSIREEDTPDADFANDFLGDSGMKGKTFKSIRGLLRHLPRRACQEAIEAAESCMNRWRNVSH